MCRQSGLSASHPKPTEATMTTTATTISTTIEMPQCHSHADLPARRNGPTSPSDPLRCRWAWARHHTGELFIEDDCYPRLRITRSGAPVRQGLKCPPTRPAQTSAAGGVPRGLAWHWRHPPPTDPLPLGCPISRAASSLRRPRLPSLSPSGECVTTGRVDAAVWVMRIPTPSLLLGDTGWTGRNEVLNRTRSADRSPLGGRTWENTPI
jgi:hypothetical protein